MNPRREHQILAIRIAAVSLAAFWLLVGSHWGLPQRISNDLRPVAATVSVTGRIGPSINQVPPEPHTAERRLRSGEVQTDRPRALESAVKQIPRQALPDKIARALAPVVASRFGLSEQETRNFQDNLAATSPDEALRATLGDERYFLLSKQNREEAADRIAENSLGEANRIASEEHLSEEKREMLATKLLEAGLQYHQLALDTFKSREGEPITADALVPWSTVSRAVKAQVLGNE